MVAAPAGAPDERALDTVHEWPLLHGRAPPSAVSSRTAELQPLTPMPQPPCTLARAHVTACGSVVDGTSQAPSGIAEASFTFVGLHPLCT